MKKLIFLITILFGFSGIANASFIGSTIPIADNDGYITSSSVEITGGFTSEDDIWSAGCDGNYAAAWSLFLIPSPNCISSGNNIVGSVNLTSTNTATYTFSGLRNNYCYDAKIQWWCDAAGTIKPDSQPSSSSIGIDTFQIINSALFTLPTDGATAFIANAQQIVLDLWVLLALVIGVPLAFYIIGKVVDLIPVKEEK